MKFKTPALEDEFLGASVFLQHLAEDFDKASKNYFGQEAIVTRIKESICGSSGVHEDYRAIDFRNEFDGGRLYDEEQVKFLVNYMNLLYPRNDEKTTCIHHSFDGGPLHFHVQLARLTKTYERKTPIEEPATPAPQKP